MRRLKTGRRPPIYPKTPGHLPCSSLTHPLPLSSRRPSVSFGGFGLKLDRIFGDTQGQEEPQVGLPNIGMLRRIASAAQRSGDQRGVPPDFPSDISLPRMYYLYVTPSE